MDRRTLLAVGICFVIFVAWQKLYLEPRTAAAPPPQAAAVSTAAPGAVAAQAPAPDARAKPTVFREITLSTGVAKVSDGSRAFADWKLDHYRRTRDAGAAPIDLASVTHEDGQLQVLFDRPELAYLADARGELTKDGDAHVWTYKDENVLLRRKVSVPSGARFADVEIFAEFRKAKASYAFVSLNSLSPEDDEEKMDRGVGYLADGKFHTVHVHEGVEVEQITAPVKWIASLSRYFVMAAVSQGPVLPTAVVQPSGAGAGRVSMVFPVTGDSVRIPLRAYFGARELQGLKEVDPSLDQIVDFGWFTAIAYPILRFMNWLYGFFHNYGVAIIILTILLKIVTYPLTYKSMKSMRKMAGLQPQLQKLRDKYKDDREALNREMMIMMKSHGYNPMAGCLPILVQMPVFFALYRVLYGSVELYQAPFALWLHDLSLKDPYYVTPVLLTVTMYFQQKLTPNTATDPVQAKMMQMMPLIFGLFMLTLPSGLTLYMLTNALASIVQQLILNRRLGPYGSPAPAGAK